MSHGERGEDVEEEQDLTLAQRVDIVGQIAWVALLSAMQQAYDPARGPREIRLARPEPVLHYRLEPTAFVSFPSPEGREVTFSDIPAECAT